MRVMSFVITFVTLTSAAWGAGDRAGTGAVRFELFGDGGIVVPVTIDGRGPFRFLLDTGSSHSAVSAALASGLALPATARTLVTTPAGETWRPVVRVQFLVVGPITVPEIWPSVFDGRHAGGGVHGLLGQDVLARLRYTLDYDRRTLSWAGAPTSNRARVRLPLEWESGCPIVTTAPARGRRALRLIPDTGASHIVLFDRGDGGLPPHRQAEGFITAGTLEDQRAVRPIVISELRIGAAALRDEKAAVIDGRGRTADGVLPLHRFARVTMDGPGGYLEIEMR